MNGVIKLQDEIEIRPGLVTKDADGKVQCRPIYSRIESLFAEQNPLKLAVPGGLIGVGTLIDPTLCRADRLVGFVLGHRGQLPSIYTEIEVNYFLLRRLLGVKTADGKQASFSFLEFSIWSISFANDFHRPRLLSLPRTRSLWLTLVLRPLELGKPPSRHGM